MLAKARKPSEETKKPHVFLEQDIGPISMEVMSSIKEALDRKGILNPGKVGPGRL